MNEGRVLMSVAIGRQRPAMGTWFEVRLVGDDGESEHLADVAGAVLDEVERVERLLSRFDPRSEVARINREAAGRAVRIDTEVFAILETCWRAWKRTHGYFDVTVPASSFAAVVLDPRLRTVRFDAPGLALDLGGIGKGYALDRGAEIAVAQGVRSAFLHGGTSSILALGHDPGGRPWTIGVRDPCARGRGGETAELFQVGLSGRGFSCSATRAPGQADSDLIDPHRREPVPGMSGCVVLAGDATGAEVLSTALLCMGKEQATGHAVRYAEAERFDVAWIESSGDGDHPTWSWLTSPER
jgi:thiamine biosynthesis lipoprotein